MKNALLAALAALAIAPAVRADCPKGFDCAGYDQEIMRADSDSGNFFGTFHPALSIGFDVRPSIGWNGPQPEFNGWDYDRSGWTSGIGVSIGLHVALARRGRFRFPTLGVNLAGVDVPGDPLDSMGDIGYSVDMAVGGEVVVQRFLKKDGSLAKEASLIVSLTRSMLGPQRGTWGLRFGLAAR